MFDLSKEWDISFAGCGFMGIYYVGASSCILERFPRFIQDASKFYGSSSGALMAATLATGIPLENCCADLMSMAREARRHRLGPLHPAFNLLHMVQTSLQESLPEDAHVRASGRLCVSLTRMPDGKNVLVSDFGSRDELIQVLLCSCFIPLYCGVVPPTYRGLHYVDGAVSDNLPRCYLKNTVTFSAYAGESDICPPAGTMNLHEVRFNNVSIHLSSENIYRVTSTFFPPEAEVMCKFCQNGYQDALRFLHENNLITSESPRGLETDSSSPACGELEQKTEEEEEEEGEEERSTGQDGFHRGLTEELPLHIRRALYDACRESRSADGLSPHVVEHLPKKVTSYLQLLPSLPVVSARRLVDWISDVPKDMSWLYGMAEGILYKPSEKNTVDDGDDRESTLSRCLESLPLGLNGSNKEIDSADTPPGTPENTPKPSLVFPWHTDSEVDHMPLTPPPTPSICHASEFGEANTESPNDTGGGWGLGRAMGLIRNIASEQTSRKQENK